MQFLEYPEGKRMQFKRRQEVELRTPSYSQNDCDLRFSYEKGGETRGIWLTVTREEAKELLRFLNEFLTDKDWNDDAR